LGTWSSINAYVVLLQLPMQVIKGWDEGVAQVGAAGAHNTTAVLLKLVCMLRLVKEQTQFGHPAGTYVVPPQGWLSGTLAAQWCQLLSREHASLALGLRQGAHHQFLVMLV
jgi:hypothetical protein